MRGSILAGVACALLGGILAFAADSTSREIPEGFGPFEHMVGSWKGTGVPTANRVKGWGEKHNWAWKFAKGNPIAMTVELEGDKTLAKGLLSFDAESGGYRLEGTDPAGKPVVFAGKLDSTGKTLKLDRVGASGEGKDRLTISPNSNLIRYMMYVDHEDAGAPQYKRVIEVGLTKEGESFAAGATAANLPKCIITGGSASMSVTYQGKSYPLCCTGCREEFNDNPEKYVKKAALITEKGGGKTPVNAASSVGKDDGSFEGLVDDSMPKAKAKTATKTAPTRPATKKAEPAEETKAEPAEEPEPKAVVKAEPSKNAAKAASLLRMAQNLEKAGKTTIAVKYYQQVVKDFAGTPQAKAAAVRIKALEE